MELNWSIPWKLKMKNRIAVLISDIHFNLTTLPLASAALKAALLKAEELQIPLIIAGDLNDTKAIIRAEVANAIISILKESTVKIYILEGNHDKVNEKGSEHGLNYLRPYAKIVDEKYVVFFKNTAVMFIPYQNNTETLKDLVKHKKTVKILIMHQGFLGAQMGDYIQDKSSIEPDLVKDFTVISGHYHRHQTLWSKMAYFLRLPFGKGTITYIGSPYTITYGEANDGPKGFLILNEDGSFTREVLNLRKHIIKEYTVSTLYQPVDNYNPGDLVWLKVTGFRAELEVIDKKELGLKLFGHSNFKLDFYPLEEDRQVLQIKDMTDSELLDQIIDSGSESVEEKLTLKDLWRKVLNETN